MGSAERVRAFTMALSEEDVHALFVERRPRAYFRVVEKEPTNGYYAVLAATTEPVVWAIDRAPEAQVLIRLDAEVSTIPALAPFVVRGRFLEARGGSLPEAATIRAFDRQLRSEDLLGETTADERGFFSIEYKPVQIGGDKLRPDVVVRAYGPGETVIAESPGRCAAPPTLVLDLIANGTSFLGPSEAETVTDRVGRVIGAVPLDTVTAEEMDHLACSLGADRQSIATLVSAAKLRSQMPGVDQNALYGLVAAGLPTEPRELLRRSPRELRRTLESAIADGLVPYAMLGQLDARMTELRGAARDLAFLAPGPGTTANVGDVLSLALGTTEGLREEFVDEYLAFGGNIATFWDHLATRPSFASPPPAFRGSSSRSSGAR